MARKSNFRIHLDKIVTEIFELAFDPNVCGFVTETELAAKAGLATPTINRLRRGVTQEPRYSTIRKLAIAIKMDVHLLNEDMLTAISKLKGKKRKEYSLA